MGGRRRLSPAWLDAYAQAALRAGVKTWHIDRAIVREQKLNMLQEGLYPGMVKRGMRLEWDYAAWAWVPVDGR